MTAVASMTRIPARGGAMVLPRFESRGRPLAHGPPPSQRAWIDGQEPAPALFAFAETRRAGDDVARAGVVERPAAARPGRLAAAARLLGRRCVRSRAVARGDDDADASGDPAGALARRCR